MSLAVRPKWALAGNIEAAVSYGTRSLLQAYRMARGGHPELYVEVPLVPPSANKLYRKTKMRPGKNGKMAGGMALDPAVVEFRDMVTAKLWGRKFVPSGTVGLIIVVESERWLTKKFTVNQRDVDNPIKCTMDALQKALDMPDQLVFEVHCAKLFGRRDATHCWLFDISDVVPAIGAA